MVGEDKKYRFRFKRFGVNDSDCAMKIGTDGVLLGAWCDVAKSHQVLDVGSGCGLIALMIAQRSKALITGIEIDPSATRQSTENIGASPWGDRIGIVNADFVEWASNEINNHRFDHIVSNPPFFSNGPAAPLSARATARHDNTLGYDQLINLSKRLLTADGKLSMISPIERKDDIIFHCELAQMHISRITTVYSKSGGKAVRIMWEIGLEKTSTINSAINIRNSNNQYSSDYIDLTKDFYLNFR